MSKSRFREFQRALARIWLKFFAWVFQFLPYGFVSAMGDCIVAVALRITLRHRKVARQSLRIAFGNEKSDEEIQSIVDKCFEYVGYGLVEMAYYMSHPQDSCKNVEIEGIEKLDEALKRGKGVIAVTAHYGNFPLMMLRLAQEKNYKVSSVLRRPRDEKIGKFLYKKKRAAGVEPIYSTPKQECVTKVINALRENHVLFLPIDQNFGSGGGIYIDFFGKEAATSPSPAIFAQRTEAVILPVFIIHEGKKKHRIVVEDPIELIEGSNDEQTVLNTMSKITHLIESYIRKYPYEWAWMHRRWKTQPAPKTEDTFEKQLTN